MSNIESAGRATVLVCITCRTTDVGDSLAADAPRPGLFLAEATAAAAVNAPDVSVQRVRCLGNCSRGLSAAIRCDDAWTYVFGGLDASRDGLTLIAGARLLAGAADGIMPWQGRPEPLKRGLIARIPPCNFQELP
jgi:predicted metal-binding protein